MISPRHWLRGVVIGITFSMETITMPARSDRRSTLTKASTRPPHLRHTRGCRRITSSPSKMSARSRLAPPVGVRHMASPRLSPSVSTLGAASRCLERAWKPSIWLACARLRCARSRSPIRSFAPIDSSSPARSRGQESGPWSRIAQHDTARRCSCGDRARGRPDSWPNDPDDRAARQDSGGQVAANAPQFSSFLSYGSR